MTTKKEVKASEIVMRIKAMSLDELNIANPKKLLQDGHFTPGKIEVKLNFDLGFQTTAFVKSDIFQVSVIADILTKNQNKKDFKIGKFQYTIDFEIKDLIQFNIVSKKNSKPQILLPPEVEHNLISMAYCTARGALFTRSLGLYTDAIMLPILETDTIKEKIEKKFKSKTPTATLD